MSSSVTIYVCASCRAAGEVDETPRAGARLATALEQAARDSALTVVPVECLSVCRRPVTIGFAAPGKWSYVFGDFAPDAADAILAAARQFAAAPNGLIPWRERPEALKRGVIARLPPFPLSHETTP
jgi:predicted metal-binding protein